MKCLIYLFMLHLILNWISYDEITYYIEIGEKKFPFKFKNTNTANEIKSKIPFTIQMTNLNGNEVYYYFSETFTTDIKSVGTINIGDIYLYQNNCLVLFYKTFTTTYSYTTVGSITNTEGLADAIGSGSVTVSWKSSADKDNDNESDDDSNEDSKEDNNDNNSSDLLTINNSSNTNGCKYYYFNILNIILIFIFLFNF